MRECKIFSQVTEEELNIWFAQNQNIEIEDLRMSERPGSISTPITRRLVDFDKPRGDYDLVIAWVVIFFRRAK